MYHLHTLMHMSYVYHWICLTIKGNTTIIGDIDVLINLDNFRAAMITSANFYLDKVIYRLGEFGNFN
jgi:hypothetical protein